MVKALDSRYEAGRRGAAWVKVKRATTLDLVVLAAEWGHGRRQGKLSNLHLGARDPASGGFVMLGKTFKGMTDEMLAWQTGHLLGLATERDGHVVHVRPELVVEIAFDGVQASTRYPGGLALRFARVKGYRPDKSRGRGRHDRHGPRAARALAEAEPPTPRERRPVRRRRPARERADIRQPPPRQPDADLQEHDRDHHGRRPGLLRGREVLPERERGKREPGRHLHGHEERRQPRAEQPDPGEERGDGEGAADEGASDDAHHADLPADGEELALLAASKARNVVAAPAVSSAANAVGSTSRSTRSEARM